MTEPIVVTGGGTGIGRAVVRRLVADGLDVLAVGRGTSRSPSWPRSWASASRR